MVLVSMCKINCSGGCIDCAPEEHTPEYLAKMYFQDILDEIEGKTVHSNLILCISRVEGLAKEAIQEINRLTK
jgi:hypothetical protein